MKNTYQLDLRRYVLQSFTGNYVSGWDKVKGKEFVAHTQSVSEAKRFSLMEAEALIKKWSFLKRKPIELIQR